METNLVAAVSGGSAVSSDPIVIVSSSMTSIASSVASPGVIFLDNPIILPSDQPDLLQQALAEAALPSSSSTATNVEVPTKLPIQTTTQGIVGKEPFVTVFNSRDGTLRLTQENARALGIGISSNDGKTNPHHLVHV